MLYMTRKSDFHVLIRRVPISGEEQRFEGSVGVKMLDDMT